MAHSAVRHAPRKAIPNTKHFRFVGKEPLLPFSGWQALSCSEQRKDARGTEAYRIRVLAKGRAMGFPDSRTARLSALLLLVITSTAMIAESPALNTADSAPTLPEIGRTRSSSPVCAEMRNVVIPVFALAQQADKIFVEPRKRLPDYGSMSADDHDSASVYREAQLARLRTDAALLLEQTLQMRKLIDVRASPAPNDAGVREERALIDEVYEAQQMRAALLSEFVQREDVSLGVKRVGMEDTGGLGARNGNPQGVRDGTPKVPPATAPPGMPLLTGLIPIADRSRLADWGALAASTVRASENNAAKAFLPIAQSCR